MAHVMAQTLAVRPDDPGLTTVVTEVSDRTGRPWRPLHLLTLLNAPQLADRRGMADACAVSTLVRELAAEMPPSAEWRVPLATSPRELSFTVVSDEQSSLVMRSFHYLRSPRTDGTSYGLVDATGHTVALCVVSPLDVAAIADLLCSRGRRPASAAVVSRVFAFDGSPPNSLSYLLARVAEAERERGTDDLVTYVNPNMGFTGASYRASGWQRLGDEPGTRYQYLDRRYITGRELATRFGHRSDDELASHLGARFAVSKLELQPLELFWRPLARDAHHSQRNRRLATTGRTTAQAARISQLVPGRSPAPVSASRNTSASAPEGSARATARMPPGSSLNGITMPPRSSRTR